MRSRIIKSAILEDDKTAHLTDGEFRLFLSLILLADDYGNLYAQPERIKSVAFWGAPGKRNIEADLETLCRVGLVEIYIADGQRYCAVRNWEKHQTMRYRARSNIPKKGDLDGALINYGAPMVYGDAPLIPRREEKRREEYLSSSDFDAWWKAYPRKVERKLALRAWEKASEKPPLAEMLAVLERQKKTEQWTQEGGKFIPHPTTYLNRQRWVAEIIELPSRPVSRGQVPIDLDAIRAQS